MSNNLSYQQARTIRKTKFTDLFVDQLAQKDTGVFGAIGKTISLRTSARFKGFKEKFDPLNIAKFLTFGSKIGPALYGKMVGRNQKDIDYFTNRSRAIKGSYNTAEKIGPSKNDGMQGINEQLAKIYEFLKSSRNEDTKHEELMNNNEEEFNTEKERRHRELIETLKKLVKNLGTGTVTATAEPDNSFLNSLWAKLKGLADVVSSLKDAMIEIAKKLGLPLASALTKLGRWGWLAATNPITAVITAGAVASVNAVKQLENYSDEQLDQIIGGGDPDAAVAAAAIKAGRAEGDRLLQNERNERIQQLLSQNEAPFLLRMYGSQAAKREWLEKNTKISRPELDDIFGEKEAPAPKPLMDRSNDMNSNRSKSGKLERQDSTTTPNPTSQPENFNPKTNKGDPVSGASSSGTTVNRLTIDNNIQEMAALQAPRESVINTTKNTSVASQNQSKFGLKPSQISVRNDEPTFMQLIIDSTRVV